MEVFVAVIDEHVNRLMRVLWEAMAASNDPMERLYRGIDAYLAFAEEHPQGFRLMRAAGAEADLPAGGRLGEVRESIARGLSNTIADVMRGAGLGAEGAPIYAHALLGAAESVVTWWLEAPEATKPDRATVTDHLLAFAWRGFDGLPRDPTRLHRQRTPGLVAMPGLGPAGGGGG